MALQPHQLGDLHLGRHRRRRHGRAPGGRWRCIPRPRRRRGGRARRWCPSPGSPLVETESGAPAGVADHQRAGGVEADAEDRGRIHARALDRLAHRGADALPDVLRAVLGMVGQRPVQPDRPLRAPEAAARRRRTHPPARCRCPTSTPMTSRSISVASPGSAQRSQALAARGSPSAVTVSWYGS